MKIRFGRVSVRKRRQASDITEALEKEMLAPGYDLFQVLTILVSIMLSQVHGIQHGSHDSCLLQASVVPITRQMQVTHDGQSISATCSGDITLKKCEGVCESSVSPSVRLVTGYRKVCRCCREIGTRTKFVPLTSCYNNGQPLANVQAQIAITEMTNCSCSNCDD
ncbi:partner of bursicon [Plakobranchus ocellatus]|uniref:Partner of bursicon n=1 Tax=Plakobranchus ocellatus TaxID=259542 RepID=A0AAV4DNI2_9GAST|nr:partner of bursicon [Plakobranchus ocellatus]